MPRPDLDWLSRIADDRLRRVAEMAERVPGHVLRSRIGVAPPAGRLERRLRRGPPSGPIRLIAEIKRASPSRGALHPVSDPAAIARLYQAGGAAAISIVTEPDHFQGELEWFASIRPEVQVPLLLKDFVIDSYQLLDAAARGADGVLLIAALLSEVRMQRLIGEARLLGLDCLVEVHDEDELRRSIRAGATVVGINNRDLRTFEVDLETSLNLLPIVPPLVTAVAESGIARPEELSRLRDTRCDAVLVGEALLTSGDPAATLATLVAAARGAS
ncbi:MAG TPA: indole-3-glycerol phosphate synthase TrpC [Candidatus Limnocylindria bacterium]|nr:indole-3-glycerol phosphate synthase TrpC [Candidatus Limnocylindria bacterium]